MVEGPGCRLNGEMIRSRVQRGQRVKTVHTTDGGSSLQCLEGQQFSGVQTLGKELFMYFGVRALRIHFGMNGLVRVNPSERTGRRAPAAALHITLSRDTLCFYNTTLQLQLSEECKQKVEVMMYLDVCSPSFSVARAVEAVCKERTRCVCDVLLDQSVLPGVGNIIKNEALILSALNPAVKVGQLTVELVRHLVKMTRDFTLLFYQCRKRGSSLNKHCRIYNRSSCGCCGDAVTVCRLGDGDRMTYFCQRCQTQDPAEIDISKLHGTAAFLRWTDRNPVTGTDHAATKQDEGEEEWSCELCTLINQPIRKFCEACMSPRPRGSAEAARNHAPGGGDLINFPHNRFTKPQGEQKINRTAAFGNTTLVLTDLSWKENTLNSTTDHRANGKDESGAIGVKPDKRAAPGVLTNASKRRRTEPDRPTDGTTPNENQPSIRKEVMSSSSTPRCPTHRCPSVLKVVHKEGSNRGRCFYTCSLPRGKQCHFFEWADLHFPVCHHGKRTLRRTVLKLGPNNGRCFYVCPLEPREQCDFFQWVEQEALSGGPVS